MLLADIEPYLTPITAPDQTPPAVTVVGPNGGESIAAGDIRMISYTATDASGIARIDIDLSEDGGATYDPIATNVVPGSSWNWFVPNLPGSQSRIRVTARDNAGNVGQDASNASFTIAAVTGGHVPTTLRDMKLPGTQPHRGAILDDPQTTCVSCHGNFAAATEPYAVWQGSMMAQAARDPLFFACLAVAEQDAPSVGDLCLRCHTPGGWQEGRSVDTSGNMLTAKDRQGVQCDFCHRQVDFDYVPGVSPPQDAAVLAGLSLPPQAYANGMFINDPAALRRGPFADVTATHAWVQSPYHTSAALCGTCHDVSNPVFERDASGDYVPGSLDAPHSDLDLRRMFPVERTFSEWSQSAYASSGVYAPQFAGNRPDGMVRTCQDCHMRDVNGAGSNETGSPVRPDLPLHDLTGGNTFVPDLLPAFFPGEVDVARLQAGKQRAVEMLQKAAMLQVTSEIFGVTVRVINETGHKLPSGYPEGRRIWLQVRAKDESGTMVYESGAYDAATGVLTHDEDLKLYEIHSGLSPALAAALGLPAGPSFHFVLCDSVYVDNRIPPRGFTNAGFTAVQSPPVGYTYADGAYWDDTAYHLPSMTDSVEVSLYYQTTSKEYIEFLRDENTTNSAGQDLYDAWVAQGRCPPVLMQRLVVPVHVTVDVAEEDGADAILSFEVGRAVPNPFRGMTALAFALPRSALVRIAVYDVRGRQVSVLADEVRGPGRYRAEWNGRDSAGNEVSSGLYFLQCQTGEKIFTQRLLRLR